MRGGRSRRGGLISTAVLLLVVTATVEHASANPIPAENMRPGTTAWLAAEVTPPAIEGYSSAVSAAPGESISFHVSTDPPAAYRIVVYRLGWYGGSGGRLLTCIPSCFGHLVGSAQAAPTPFGLFGEIRADWPIAATLSVPLDWVSGYYVAELLLMSGPGAGSVDRVPFIVRERGRRSQVIAQVPVNTWQAYNGWGGKSTYEHSSSGGRRAVAVSFDRPYFMGPGRQEMTDWELALVRWLERSGYDVSYQTDVDTHRDPAALNAHRLVLTLGHDEYWTKEMRDGFEAARALGTNLGFLGANAAYWQVRYANGERTMITHKSLYDPEPVLELKTAMFREVGRPECALIGVQHQGGLQNWGRHDYFVTAAGARDPWAAGTGFVEGSRIERVVSVEVDTVPRIGCGSQTVLFRYDAGGDTLGDASAVRYTAASGARVFAAGTMELGWGLDPFPAAPVEDTAPLDERLVRFMANAMDDLTRPAPPTSLTVVPEPGGARVSVGRTPDPRVRFDVLRRTGGDETSILDPGWRVVCRAVAATCRDDVATGGVFRYAAVAVDEWARSQPVLSAPVSLDPAANGPRPRVGELLVVRLAGATTDLFSVDLRSLRARRLARTALAELQPTWSRDGRRVAVTVDRIVRDVPPEPSSASRVVVRSADGSGLRDLGAGRSPTWSPDGHSLALERGGTIFVVDATTRRARPLTVGHNPAWSRRGVIAFETERGISTILRNGRGRRLLVVGGRAPSWSPNGTRLAFVRAGSVSDAEDRAGQLHVVTAAGRRERAYLLRVTRPTWSADGRWLAGADERGRVCIVRVGRPRTLACLPLRGRNYDPAWRPTPAAARGRR